MVVGFFVFINNTNIRWTKITTLTSCISTRNIGFDKPFLTDYFPRKYGLLRDYSHRYWSLLSFIGYVFKQFFKHNFFKTLHSFHIFLFIILCLNLQTVSPRTFHVLYIISARAVEAAIPTLPSYSWADCCSYVVKLFQFIL